MNKLKDVAKTKKPVQVLNKAADENVIKRNGAYLVSPGISGSYGTDAQGL